MQKIQTNRVVHFGRFCVPIIGVFGVILLFVAAGSSTVFADELPESESTGVYREPKFKAESERRWDFQTELGYQNLRGSSTYHDLNGAVSGGYDNGIDEWRGEATYQNLASPSKVTSNRFFTRNSFERYLGTRFWALAMSTFEYAPLKGITGDLHSGVGFKYDLLRSSIWKMNISEIVMLRNQWATDSQYRSDWVSSSRFLFKAKLPIAELGFSLYLQPALSGNNHGLLVDVFAILNPKEHLTVKVGFNYFYYFEPLNRAAPGIDSGEYIRLIYRL